MCLCLCVCCVLCALRSYTNQIIHFSFLFFFFLSQICLCVCVCVFVCYVCAAHIHKIKLFNCFFLSQIRASGCVCVLCFVCAVHIHKSNYSFSFVSPRYVQFKEKVQIMAEQMANRQNPPIATLNDFQRLAREFTLACDSRDEVRNQEELYQV